jgi:thiol-disulfide isomerase/thioredoxin
VLAFRDGGYLPWAGALVCGAVVLVFAWRWGRASSRELSTEAVIASVPSAERTTALEDAGAAAGARHGPSAATGKRRFRLLLAPAAAGLGVFLAGQLLLEAGAKHEPLPSFEVFDTKGAPIQLAAAVGRPMVINLWASWCAPCRREMPAFARVQAQRLDVDFVFLNIGESLQEIEAFTRTLSVPLSPILRDPQGRVPARLEVRGYPTTLVLDGQGRLLHRRSGELSEASLKALLPPAPGGAQQPSRPRAN